MSTDFITGPSSAADSTRTMPKKNRVPWGWKPVLFGIVLAGVCHGAYHFGELYKTGHKQQPVAEVKPNPTQAQVMADESKKWILSHRAAVINNGYEDVKQTLRTALDNGNQNLVYSTAEYCNPEVFAQIMSRIKTDGFEFTLVHPGNPNVCAIEFDLSKLEQ